MTLVRCVAAALAFLVSCAHAAPEAAAPYAATPAPVVGEILRLANVGPDDLLIDLGSGDGRVVIAAARERNTRGIGVDIEPSFVALSNAAAARAGVADRARFLVQDLFVADLREATVVTVYLLPQALERVEQKLRAELRPGARVVVQDYPLPTWRPDRVVEVRTEDAVANSGRAYTQLFLYVIRR